MSVERRKKFNHTLAPTALGIQSIIIGSSFKEDEKDAFNEESPREETKAVPDISMTHARSSLEGRIKHLTNPKLVDKKDLKDQNNLELNESDVEQMMKVTKSPNSILLGERK